MLRLGKKNTESLENSTAGSLNSCKLVKRMRTNKWAKKEKYIEIISWFDVMTFSWLHDKYSIKEKFKTLFPGLLAAVTVAIASRFLADHYASPIMLFALLIGMGFHFLYEDKVCSQGIDFASKNIL